MADGLTIKLAFLPGNGVDHRPVCLIPARDRNAGKARHAITKLSAGIGFAAGHHAQVWTADYLGPFIGEIGRETWRERGCRYGEISVVAVSLTTKKTKT